MEPWVSLERTIDVQASLAIVLCDAFICRFVHSLQHGVCPCVLRDKLLHTRFEPSGWTGCAELGYAKSIMDYLFRRLELRFLSGTQFALFSASGNRGSLVADPGKVVPISPPVARFCSCSAR